MKMTEHNNKIEQQRERLKTEALERLKTEVDTALEIRAGRIQTWYESGRVVTEYPRDKRKKTITDHRGIK
jgi:antitoxin component YwqK of YwqJK toxin-antitoxin module